MWYLAAFAIAMVIAVIVGSILGDSYSRRRTEINEKLHSAAPEGFEATDEFVAEDFKTAIHVDRRRAQFILWEGSLASVRLLDASAIRTIEYCEDGYTSAVGVGAGLIGPVAGGIGKARGKTSRIHLRLQLSDVDQPYVALCFLNQRSGLTHHHPLYRRASELAREWKARLEALSERVKTED
jgi:hypothetical protein